MSHLSRSRSEPVLRSDPKAPSYLFELFLQTGDGKTYVTRGDKVFSQLRPDDHLHICTTSYPPQDLQGDLHCPFTNMTTRAHALMLALSRISCCSRLPMRCAFGQLSRRVSMALVSGDDTHRAPSNFASAASLLLSSVACTGHPFPVSDCNCIMTYCRDNGTEHARTCRRPLLVSLGLKI